MTKSTHKTLIIGAGFSYPLGLPLANQIIPWLWKRWHAEDDDPLLAETKIETDFWITQARACGMIQESVDFERFLAFLESAASVWSQINDYTPLPIRDANWPDYISWPPSPSAVEKSLTSRFLNEIRSFQNDPLSDSAKFQAAANLFAHLLQPGDSILTFNYDSLVEHSLFLAFGRGMTSEGKLDRDRISVCHLHGCADWQLYELLDGKDDDPETTIQMFSRQRKTWKLRKTGGEFDLNPYRHYEGLQNVAVQMIPYKSIPWFLATQWEQGLDCLQKSECLIIIGYSFPLHDSAARFAVRTALNANPRAKIFNIDPKAADPLYRQSLISLLGRTVEFIPLSWCDWVAERSPL